MIQLKLVKDMYEITAKSILGCELEKHKGKILILG